MPRGGPRYRGKPKEEEKPRSSRPIPKPKPYQKPRYRGKKPSRSKRTVKNTDDLLKISEEEYGDSKYASDIARANPQVRNITAGVVLNLPTVEEPEPVTPELTMVRPRRGRFGAPGRREEPGGFPQGPGIPQHPQPGIPQQPFGIPQYQPRPGQTTPFGPAPGPPAPAPEGRFLQPGYAGRGTQAGQPTQAAEAIRGTQAGPYTAPGPGGTALLGYNPEGRPFAVVNAEGRTTYGTSIVPYLLEQGIAPLMITPYDVNVVGLDQNLLVEYGYTQDDWGNWVRPALEPETPPGGGGRGGGGGGYAGYGGYYGYGRGGGRRGGGGGTVRPASYSGRQILDYLGLGQVSWRI